MLVLVLGAGAGAVSWVCTWWRQVAGAGPGAGAGGGAVSWLCTWGVDRLLGCARGGDRLLVLVPGVGAGARF